jgi:hypothetical protein
MLSRTGISSSTTYSQSWTASSPVGVRTDQRSRTCHLRVPGFSPQGRDAFAVLVVFAVPNELGHDSPRVNIAQYTGGLLPPSVPI